MHKIYLNANIIVSESTVVKERRDERDQLSLSQFFSQTIIEQSINETLENDHEESDSSSSIFAFESFDRERARRVHAADIERYLKRNLKRNDK